MIEINLVPDVKQELIHAQRVRMSVISIATIVGLASIAVVVVLGILLGVQGARGYLLDKSIKDDSQKLANVPDINKTLTIQNQLTMISTIHDSSHVNSRIFSLLTSLAPRDGDDKVQYSNVAINTGEDTVTIQAQTPTFNGLDVFKKTLAATNFQYNLDGSTSKQTEPLASGITISNQTQAQDASGARVVAFTLSFTYADALLSPTSKNLTINLPTKTNATDSYQGVPSSLFTEQAGGDS